MVIKQVSFRTGIIDVSSDYNFGLLLNSNINGSNKLDALVAGVITVTHSIMIVGTSVNKKSLSINHKVGAVEVENTSICDEEHG